MVLEFAVGAPVVSKSWSTYLGEVFGFGGGTTKIGEFTLDWGALLINATVTALTWIRFLLRMAVGLVVYLLSGAWHSVVGRREAATSV